MNTIHAFLYRIIVITVCSTFVLIPASQIKAQEAGTDTIYLPIVQTGAAAAPVTSAAVGVKNTVPFDQVPLLLRRRAAQYVEDMRHTELAPDWEQAYIDAAVRLFYRPDLQEVAYYEFRMFTTSDLSTEPIPAGFILLATGEHDVPVPHWSATGKSISQNLEEEAAAGDIQGELTFYKLDTLSYGAEDSTGRLVTSNRDMPPKLTGLDLSMLDTPVEPSAASWIPTESADDVNAAQLDGVMVYEGPQDSPVIFSGWESWDELKRDYKQTYEVFIEELRRDAVTEWSILDAIRTDGELLFAQTTYPMALLSQPKEIAVSGPGAIHVNYQQIDRPGLLPVLHLTTVSANANAALPYYVQIRYANGESETLNFLVIARPNEQAAVNEQNDLVTAMGYEGPLGDWITRTLVMAGTDYQQTQYDQIDPGVSPNTSNCHSGCGATAWAMLFGWADARAAENHPVWRFRWGLYLQNGGRVPPDTAAPKGMNTGVKNMIWEIRNHIGTWCYRGSGPTAPWNMSQAALYLRGRTGTQLTTRYSRIGRTYSEFRIQASDHIRDRGTPVVIGTGWLNHYPLAYGYKHRTRPYRTCHTNGQHPWEDEICYDTVGHQRQFMVNKGWGGTGNEWVRARTWFVGEIFPN